MTNAVQAAAHRRLESLAEPHLVRAGVDWGPMFGSTGLRVRGKVYAVAVYDGGLMVKISETRADERVASGEVARVVMRGREMREWVVAPADAPDELWMSLLDEAHGHLDAITP